MSFLWCAPQAVGVAPVAPPRGPPVPANLHGFSVVRQERLTEYNADAVLFRHNKTGAEVRGLSATLTTLLPPSRFLAPRLPGNPGS